MWLEKTEQKIRVSEPVDLTVAIDIIQSKYDNFRELRAELERCEPRVLSLQEAGNQLLLHDCALDGSSVICTKLTELRLKLQSLIRLTGVYILKLGAVLGRDPNEINLTLHHQTMSTGTTSSSSVIGSTALGYDVSLFNNRCVIL